MEKCYHSLEQLNQHETYEQTLKTVRASVTKRLEKCDLVNKQIESKMNQPKDVQESLNNDPIDGSIQKQIQTQAANVWDAQQRMAQVADLNDDLQELHGMMTNFATIVHDQAEPVDHIEQNITHAQEQVTEGTKSLIKARYSAFTAPLTCGLLGGAICGGPIGAVVGLKVGLLTAFSGSLLSFSTMKYIQKKGKEESNEEIRRLETQIASHNKQD